jgi:hypothetical protein
MVPRNSRAVTAAAVLVIMVLTGSDAFTSPSKTSLALHQHTRHNTCTTALHFFGNKNKEPQDESPEDNEEVPTTNFLTKHTPTIKIALPAFLLGGIATLSFLFLPLLTDYHDAFSGAASTSSFYGSSESKLAKNNINQPVILFETILNDLNEAYVDDVDIQKLFETGVKAMTSSLDPYTEFESRQEAQDLEESVSGQYGGVGLVIRGSTLTAEAEEIALEPMPSEDGKEKKPPIVRNVEEEDRAAIKRRRQKTLEDGIRVVSAFEGYAYDAGLRVGDKLLSVDDFEIKPTTTVDQVRNHLRGEPGTPVSITFQREGVGGEKNEPQTILMQRSVVHIPDVKYYGFIGDPKDAIGYIDLSGFANDAGREVRYAIRVLQHGAEMIARANGGEIRDEGRVTVDSIDTTKLKVSYCSLELNATLYCS